MTLTYYSLVLNHHQAWVADEFYKILGDGFNFVELDSNHDMKGDNIDFSARPYLIKAWESSKQYQKSMALAKSADVCVFAGFESLPFEIERLKLGLLSFDMGERWLKRGLLNLLSPRIAAMVVVYHLRGWSNKPAFKLCCSAFAAYDCQRLGAYKGRCFKWGYFTKPNIIIDQIKPLKNEKVRIMWCARFLKLKRPWMVVEMARSLKDKGYLFQLDIYGDEDLSMSQAMSYPKSELVKMIEDYQIDDCVKLKGNRPNSVIIDAMKLSDIFLFTSDRNEGWGAVANESMSCGCALVASDAIGSVPYLIEDGKTGLMFRDGDVGSLTEKVEWLLNHKTEMQNIGRAAAKSLREVWSPKNAAKSLLQLIDDIENGRNNSIVFGPCSYA